jgi:hypothetical protein
MKFSSGLLAVGILLGGLIGAVGADEEVARYSYACWLNGWRKQAGDKSPEILAIQASGYDFTLNLTDFGKAGYAVNGRAPVGYAEALETGTGHFEGLPQAELVVEVEVGGKKYRAVACEAGKDPDPRRLGAAKMWEAGRLVQHFEMVGLDFKDEAGAALSGVGSLSLVAWPDSLAFTISLSPGVGGWRDAKVRVAFAGQGVNGVEEKKMDGDWAENEVRRVTLCHEISKAEMAAPVVGVSVRGGQEVAVAFDPMKNCLVASVPRIERKFAAGYTDIRDYDEFVIKIDNAQQEARRIPFLLDFRSPANVTGLCPILCDLEGRPTGIPVQLSKNWHYEPMGAYLMAYMDLPVKPGKTEYLLRIPYGFYGSLPSASHAQLSLIGYSGKGGNGRWDQLAIGCWGETICFDVDMSLVDVAITDARMLMTRNGANGKMWQWTDGGWGGDWLGMNQAGGGKLAFRDMKTAYLAQGPCLTDVRYHGNYGAGRDVGLEAEVRTLRTDDYARTWNRLRYDFRTAAKSDRVWFFKMGKTNEYVTPRIAYGNVAGLIEEREVPVSLKPGQGLLDRVTLAGDGPWWVAFPGARHTNQRDWGTGSRALVIRSYRAKLGGKEYTRPTISMPVHWSDAEGVGLDLLLVAPPEVSEFQPGDEVELEAQWITLPRTAEDYYGPNESFRKHLAENPASWKTVYREAKGNDLAVTARGGKVLHRYPVMVKAEGPEVEVTIRGGVGYVPIRFEGLADEMGYELYEVVDGKEVKLDQAVHGNDFWQVDRDDDGTYQLTYNLPLDGKADSVWRLKKR